MKTRNKLLVLGLAGLLGLASCRKQDEGIVLGKGEYLMFGHFFGECGGERCIEIFKLENGRLLEDSEDQYPSQTDFYVGTYHQLDHTLYMQVKDLTDAFPAQLLNEAGHVIGQPDAGDWGGFYVEYNVNGTRKFWLIDQITEKHPTHAYLAPFVQKIKEKITVINQ